MKALIIISAVATIYAIIRAKLDSYLRTGPWKTWAFILGVFIAMTTVVLSLLSFDMKWWYGITLGPLFGFVFWLMFDCAVGYLFGGSILYLGSSGFDLKMRKTFKYDLPIFGWKSGAFILLLFKSFWIVLLSLIYNALL